jgi:hypothetical protein
MIIQLYHGTSTKNADKIMQSGFKQKKSNWEGKIESKKGFIYLTSAYSVYYGSQAAKEGDKFGSIVKVEVNSKDLYPDEDYIWFKHGIEHDQINLEEYKHLGLESLEKMGTCSIKLGSTIQVLGRKDFVIGEMYQYSDPSVSPMNYGILGAYYRELSRRIYEGEELETLLIASWLGKK